MTSYWAQDTFVRANQSGTWGTASNSETYSIVMGSATQAIASNEGTLTACTALTLVQFGTRTVADAEVVVRVSVSSTNYTAAGVFLRGNGSTTCYRARLNSSTSSLGFGIVKTVSGTTTNLVTSALTVSTNTFYWIRFRIVGSTLSAKVWADGSSEPPGWTVTTTDSSIAGAGNYGICNTTSSSTDSAKYDSLSVSALSTHDSYARFNLRASSSKNIGMRFRLTSSLLYLSATMRLRLAAMQQQNMPLRFLLGLGTNLRFAAMRLSVQGQARRDGSLRAVVSNLLSQRFAALRLPLFSPFYGMLATDSLQRTNQAGWNPSSDSESWSTVMGSVNQSIVANRGQVTAVNALTFMQLGTRTIANAEALVRVSVSSTNYTAAGVFLRGNGSTTCYRARLNSSTSSLGFGIVKTVSGTSTTLTSTALTVSTSTFYWIRFRVYGSTLSAKVWVDGVVEPPGWTLTITDTSIVGAGNVGLVVNTTSVTDTATFDSFSVTDVLGKRDGSLRFLVRIYGTQGQKSVGMRTLVQGARLAANGLRAIVLPVSRQLSSLRLVLVAAFQQQQNTGLRFLLLPGTISVQGALSPSLSISSPFLGGLGSIAPSAFPAAFPGYAVNGTLLSDTPYAVTVPAQVGGSVVVGSVFTLSFMNPSPATESSFLVGQCVQMQVFLSDGSLVTLPVCISAATLTTTMPFTTTTYTAPIPPQTLYVPRTFGGTLVFTENGVPSETLFTTTTLPVPSFLEVICTVTETTAYTQWVIPSQFC